MILVIHTYVLTPHHEQETGNIYNNIEKAICKIKSDENLIVLGDMNTVVGEGKKEDIDKNYSFGYRNAREDKLANFN